MMNKTILRMLSISLLMTSLFCAAEPATIENNHLKPSMSKMLKQVMPVVVNITVRGDVPALPGEDKMEGKSLRRPPILNRKFESAGSGVIVDAKNGYIVTNAHVLRFGKVFIVTLSDGRMLKAKVIGMDPLTDVAVIQVKDKYLNSIPLADSDQLEPGDFVAAIGNPFGLHQTVTSGVVSALNRSIGIEGPAGYENFIQTDAPINPGNSGGALVDMQGNLVGINTAILAPVGGSIGIGFAIPSNMVRRVMDQLIKYGKVKRGVLGVMVQSLTPDLADAFKLRDVKGAIVTHVVENSAAEKAGVKDQDVIESINGQQIKNAAQLRAIIGMLPMGDKAKMKVYRQGEMMSITATIDSLENLEKSHKQERQLLRGVRLNNFYQLDTDNKEVKGLIVLDVKDDSDAWLAGLRPGDVILNANNTAVTSISQLAKMADAKPERLLLSIRRGRANLFIVVS